MRSASRHHPLAVLFLGVCFPLLAAAPAFAREQSSNGNGTDPEVQKLARALRESKKPGPAYDRLKAHAQAHARQQSGARAALALGYFDYSRNKFDQAMHWLAQAEGDKVLREYALYWAAITERARGNNDKAFARLEAFRREFPESAMNGSVVENLAAAALATNRAERAAAVLSSYTKTGSTPALLLLRAQAGERLNRPAKAAMDYATLYYQYSQSSEAIAAARSISRLEKSLRAEFPAVSDAQRMGRAQAFFDVKRWRDARNEFTKIIPRLSGHLRDVAQLRIAQCPMQPNGSPKLLAKLTLSDGEADAERFYELSQAWRSRKDETAMLEAIEQAATRYPKSDWAAQALFSAGNYFWVDLNAARATDFYQHYLLAFPSGKDTLTAHWRLAWLAYRDQSPQAAKLLEEHLLRFPGTGYSVNALYWLGRSAERAGNAPLARSYYEKILDRYPHSYYSHRAAERANALGPGPTEPAEVLALIPAPSAVPALDAPIPPAAQERRHRAQALLSIGFDASAEAELRAAYAATNLPRLLLEAAQAAQEAQRYLVGITTARQAFPQLEARRMQDVPREVWDTVYPFPYESSIAAASGLTGLDPMLVAGLIRQESVFQREAISKPGALGLMQVMPKTGKQLARQLKLRYSRAKLFEPEFNLRVGTVYFKGLIRDFGSVEAALAAYNAGEHRVTAWQAGKAYSEPAEFVESIPFTETRDYVQIVMRNAEIYRRLHGPAAKNGPGSGNDP